MLRAMGYFVDATAVHGVSIDSFRRDPPLAVIIDLTQYRPESRMLAQALQRGKWTRSIPLVLAGGERKKVEMLKRSLPGAAFAKWEKLEPVLKRVTGGPPAPGEGRPDDDVSRQRLGNPQAGRHPVQALRLVRDVREEPAPKKPLAKRLGLEKQTTVMLVDAPVGYEDELTPLPEGVTLTRQWVPRGPDVLMVFASHKSELTKRGALRTLQQTKKWAWICRPRPSSGVTTDVTAALIKGVMAAEGWTPGKSCILDATWAGMRFMRKPAEPAPERVGAESGVGRVADQASGFVARP